LNIDVFIIEIEKSETINQKSAARGIPTQQPKF